MRQAGIVLLLLMLLTSLLFISVKIHEAKASGTIYIQADGSIDPPNSPLVTLDTVTYTLTGSVNSNASGIVVRRDHIILDGMGYTLVSGSPTPFVNGIDLSDRTNVTIRNIHIENYTRGILVSRSSNTNITDNTLRGNGIGIDVFDSNYNSIAGNTITTNIDGITLSTSSNNIVAGNTLTDNHFSSIELRFFSNYNNVTGNTIANSYEGIRFESSSNNNLVNGNTFTNTGLVVANAYQNVVQNNTVNGKPLAYLDDVANYTVADAGQVILINCTGIRVEHLNLSQTSIGAQLWQTQHSNISGNVVASNWIGMKLSSSSNISISGNTIADNRVYGIQLTSASNVSISGNNITANSQKGIWISSSIDSSIAGNTITAHNMSGIRIDLSSHLSITSNVLVDNLNGITLESSFSINISGNNMTSNWGGVALSHSHNTTVLGNTLESCWTFGVNLQGASFNTIVGNNITNTINFGLLLESSSNNNIICNNNFVNNSLHTLLFTVDVNSWDSGYPGGGNYWSGYDDEDWCKGPQQNLTGRDGVWDHPYVIVTDIHDRYPLTTPFGWFPPGDVDSDRDVDIFDITHMVGVYGMSYPSPWYDRLCDLNLDGDVDIFDIVEAAGNYGESW